MGWSRGGARHSGPDGRHVAAGVSLSTHESAGARGGGLRTLVLAALALGLGLRLAALLSGRSLWLDEAMLALNVLGRSWLELLRPLDYDQAAAPLFLGAARLMTTLGGPGAITLRLLPLLCGIGVLVLTWRLARALAGPAEAAVALLLVAVSPALIYYSAEFKPYMTDALVALGLTVLTWELARRPLTGRGLVGLLVAGLAAVAASLTAPFVLAACGGYLAGRAVDRRAPAELWKVAGVSACWATGFVALYLTAYQAGSENAYLRDFWSTDMLAHAGSPAQAIALLVRAAVFPLPLDPGVIRLALLGPGLALLLVLAARHLGASRALLLGAPALLAIGASALALYPLRGRLLLFLAPATCLAVATGLVSLGRLVLSRERDVVLLSVLLVLAAAGWAGQPLGAGPGRGEGDATVMDLLRGRPAGEPVYLMPGGGPKWVYYGTDWRAADRNRLAWYARELSYGGRAFRHGMQVGGLAPGEAAPLHPPGTTVEVVAYTSGAGARERSAPLAAWADAEVSRLRATGARFIWVYGGAYHRRDLPDLLGALERSGATWERRHQDDREVVYRVDLRPLAGDARGQS